MKLPQSLTTVCLALTGLVLIDMGLRKHSFDEPVGPAKAQLTSPPKTAQPAPPSACTWQRAEQQRLPMPEGVAAAHASTLVWLPPTHPDHAKTSLMAFWFAGTRESAADVNIVASRLDRTTGQWSPAFTVVDRHEAGRALGVRLRRLGNPVAWADASGRLHLFVVATGLGGWAASRVLHLQEDNKQADTQPPQRRWTPVRLLPLTPAVPALNTSVLVRTAPMPLADGGALLPVYFELGMKYSAVLRLGPQGQMLGMQRITHRHDVLQPALVPLSETHWLAYHRNQGSSRQMAVSQTTDAGAHWQDMPDALYSNADSSVAALRTQQGSTVMLHNPAEHGRRALWWSEGATPLPSAAWKTHAVIEGDAGEEYSYPSLVQMPATPIAQRPPAEGNTGVATRHGDLWISYTHRRQAIAVERWVPRCEP